MDVTPLAVDWRHMTDWAAEHYRCHTFLKNDRIPARPDLLYLVQTGVVQLLSNTPAVRQKNGSWPISSDEADEVRVSLVGAGQPCEVFAHDPFVLKCFAHVHQTTVIWLYWDDLKAWPHLQTEVLNAFRRQHQHQLLWLSVLNQYRAIDRLFGYLSLQIDQYGKRCELGNYLPFAITHSQISSAIGVTRVTVTRLISRLRQDGMLHLYKRGFFCIPDNANWRRQPPEDGPVDTL